MKSVLITRPKNQSQEISQFLEKQGFSAFIEPLFLIEKIDSRIKFSDEKVSAVIITSSNACEALIDYDLSKEVKVFAVGKKTAQKLQEKGFKNIHISHENSADDLKNLIIETHNNKLGLILYFHGSITSLDFEKELQDFGFKVKKILAYKTHEVENFSPEFLRFSLNKPFDHVLIFSQNSAKIFEKLARKHNLLEYFKGSQLVCLSEKILFDVKNFGFQNSITFKQFPILNKFYD
jgi:uroporphyrinogen-III synthase